ncbi:MAG: sialidase family protein [Bacteroidales bacterium]
MNILKRSTVIMCVMMLSLLYIDTSIAQEDKSYLDAPEIIKEPSSTQKYSAESRKFTGIPSVAISRNGRFWAVWYSGKSPAEDKNNYVVVATSNDKGQTWEEVLVIDPDGDGPVRAFDPEVWLDPDGQLWVFWAQQIKPARSTKSGVWTMTTSDPDSADPKWSKPRRLVDGVMMCKPTVLSDGVWALPVSFWHLMEESAKMVVSTDKGNTWSVQGAVNVPEDVRNHDEHMIVERKDRSLWMLVRTNYGIGESISSDKGNTWSPLIPSNIQHPAARFFIRRLNSGNLLLVKHGPIDMRTGRSHLMAFVSKDDGHSWSDGLLLDERRGVSYPDGQQTEDGTIYIIYDYDRTGNQKVHMTSFREDDVISGSDIRMMEVFQRRQVVSNGGAK